MNKKVRKLGFALLLLVVALAFPAMSRAAPPAACRFRGTVKVNDAFVGDGTAVSFWSADWSTMWGETTTFTYEAESVYYVQMGGDDPLTGEKEGPTQGETVRFKIGSLAADQTSTWQEAGLQVVDLTAAGPTATTTLSPTPSNTPTNGVSPTVTRTPSNTVQPTTTPTPSNTFTPSATPIHSPTPTGTLRWITVKFQQEEHPDQSYAGCQDAYLTEWEPYTPHNDVYLNVRTQDNMRSLVQFDLTGHIPQGATVGTATLYLRTGYNNGPYEADTVMYQMKKAWDEDQADWYKGMYATGHDWELPGAKGGSDITGEKGRCRMTQVDQDCEWDVAALVQEWVSYPDRNHGVLVAAQEVTRTVEYRFYASQWASKPRRPKLVVTYLEMPATATPTLTPSVTPTPENTYTPTATGTATPTGTVTPTFTPSATPDTGTVMGTVYQDVNGNTRMDEGEQGVADIPMELRDSDNRWLRTIYTAEGGTYMFSNLAPETYRVYVVYEAGFAPVHPNPPYHVVRVSAGSLEERNFGYLRQDEDLHLPLIQQGYAGQEA